jgi:hypothetical protein
MSVAKTNSLWDMRRGLAFLSVAALFATGVSSGAVATQRTYSIPGYGISLGLPSTWKSVNYREILKPGVLQAFAHDNPDLAGSFAVMAQPNSPIKFFAYDPQVANRFATNANVVVIPIGARLSVAQFRRRLASALSTVSSVSQLRSSTVRLRAGPAARLTYHLRVTVGSRSITVQTLQYGFLHAGRSIVFTYTTLPTTQRFYAGVFATSAQSIRFS